MPSSCAQAMVRVLWELKDRRDERWDDNMHNSREMGFPRTRIVGGEEAQTKTAGLQIIDGAPEHPASQGSNEMTSLRPV